MKKDIDVQSLQSLQGKRVKIFSTYGRHREGIVDSKEGRILTLRTSENDTESGKLMIFNLDNIFSIEEQ